jgi:7-carboxy-7-deazaguanine synthase
MSDTILELENETLTIAGQDNVPEIFYTLEGEGEYIGYPSVFMRLSGCNLTCKGFASKDSPNGCDSYVSWSIKNVRTFKQLAEIFDKEGFRQNLMDGALWKITGGEPLIQQKQLEKFFTYLKLLWGEGRWNSLHIDFETNGTIIPSRELLHAAAHAKVTFTSSPKLASNGDPVRLRFKELALNWHALRGTGFKFVVQSEADVKEIWSNFVENPAVAIPKRRIWFMPCCGSQAELLEKGTEVAELAKKYGVKFSNRMHLQLWDKALRV